MVSISFLQARDPSTAPEVLERLAKKRSKRIQRAIAQNPNTPWPTLKQLLILHPEEVLRNPALPLLLLADPLLFYPIELSQIEILSKQTEALAQLMGWEDEAEWAELRLTLACVAESGRPLRCSSPRGLKRLRIWALRGKQLSLDLELRLLRDRSDEVLKILAQQSREPRVLEQLLEYPKHHEKLALNPWLPKAWLWAFAEHENPHVRRRLPEQEQLPLEILEYLARDSEIEVRAAVARRRTLPPEIYVRLNHDPALKVHRAVRLGRSIL